MPQSTRAHTRAVRDRMRRAGEKYTESAAAISVIHQRMAEADETFAEAEAWYDNPRNQLLCAQCGWTFGMICPECSKGCGCSMSCYGWRHREFRSSDDFDDDDQDPDECGGCGADGAEPCMCDD